MKIVFMGSAEFGFPALKLLFENHTVTGIVTTPPRPKGRGRAIGLSPVAEFAQARNFGPIYAPEDLHDLRFHRDLAACNADLFVVVAFRILPRSLFSLPPLGTINIHASLLPKYRGPAPIQRAIEAGETETGVTVFRIDEGIDTGMILLQKRTPIGPAETTPELYDRLGVLGAEALKEVLAHLDASTAVVMGQDHSASSRAPKLSREEAAINWYLPSKVIFNKIRAFKPFPGTYTLFGGERLGIEAAELPPSLALADPNTVKPGTIVRVRDSYFDVQCLDGSLRIIEVKPAGRRRMNVHDFLLGTPMREGMML